MRHHFEINKLCICLFILLVFFGTGCYYKYLKNLYTQKIYKFFLDILHIVV